MHAVYQSVGDNSTAWYQ